MLFQILFHQLFQRFKRFSIFLYGLTASERSPEKNIFIKTHHKAIWNAIENSQTNENPHVNSAKMLNAMFPEAGGALRTCSGLLQQRRRSVKSWKWRRDCRCCCRRKQPWAVVNQLRSWCAFWTTTCIDSWHWHDMKMLFGKKKKKRWCSGRKERRKKGRKDPTVWDAWTAWLEVRDDMRCPTVGLFPCATQFELKL